MVESKAILCVFQYNGSRMRIKATHIKDIIGISAPILKKSGNSLRNNTSCQMLRTYTHGLKKHRRQDNNNT